MRNQVTHVGPWSLFSPLPWAPTSPNRCPPGAVPLCQLSRHRAPDRHVRMPQPLGPRTCGQDRRALMNPAYRGGHISGTATLFRETSAISHAHAVVTYWTAHWYYAKQKTTSVISYKTPSVGLSNRATMSFRSGHDEEDVKKTLPSRLDEPGHWK
jgi:hypothetical protein